MWISAMSSKNVRFVTKWKRFFNYSKIEPFFKVTENRELCFIIYTAINKRLCELCTKQNRLQFESLWTMFRFSEADWCVTSHYIKYVYFLYFICSSLSVITMPATTPLPSNRPHSPPPLLPPPNTPYSLPP